MRKAYNSEALIAIYESMADLHKIGASDDATMREFEPDLPSPAAESVEGLKELGKRKEKRKPASQTEN